MRGKGLGHKLLTTLMDAARANGLKFMEGEVLKNNTSMLKLMSRLGFSVETDPEDKDLKFVRKVL